MPAFVLVEAALPEPEPLHLALLQEAALSAVSGPSSFLAPFP